MTKPTNTAPAQTPPEDITALRGELWAMFKLGGPMALAQLAQMAILTIDAIMIGHLGPQHLAALSLGLVVYFAFWMLGFGPAISVSPMAAQALGADKENRADVRRSVRASLWMILLFTPPVFYLAWHAPIGLVFLGQNPDTSYEAGRYVKAIMLGWPFSLAVMSLRNYLAVLGKTTIPLWIMIVSIGINAFLNWVFIFGALGAPRLELVGAGIASAITSLMTFLMFAAYAYWDRESRRFKIFKNFHKLDPARLKELFTLSWPISITTFFEGMLFNGCTLIVGVIGTLEVAAYQIVLNVASLAYMLPWGFAMAGAARVGLAVGAGSKPAILRVSYASFILGLTSICLVGIPALIWPSEIANIYMEAGTEDTARVLAMAVIFMPVAVGFMLFDAAQMTANQLLRGMKDVRWPMVLTCFSYWVVGFGAAFYLALYTPMGAIGVWYGMLAGLVCAAVLLTIRVRMMFRTF